MPNPDARRADRLADAAVADDPERGAVHVDAQEVADVEPGPAALAEVGLGIGRPPRRREQQEEGEIGGGLVEHPWRVADRDPELGSGGDVDVVVAHGHVGDDLQPRRARPQDVGVDAIGEDADDRVDVTGRGAQVGGGPGLVAGALHDLVPGGDDGIEPALRQLAGHEDTGHAEGA